MESFESSILYVFYLCLSFLISYIFSFFSLACFFSIYKIITKKKVHLCSIFEPSNSSLVNRLLLSVPISLLILPFLGHLLHYVCLFFDLPYLKDLSHTLIRNNVASTTSLLFFEWCDKVSKSIAVWFVRIVMLPIDFK